MVLSFTPQSLTKGYVKKRIISTAQFEKNMTGIHSGMQNQGGAYRNQRLDDIGSMTQNFEVNQLPIQNENLNFKPKYQ